MYKISEKMKNYSVGTDIIITISDEPEKDYLGLLHKDKSGRMCVLFDDGCCYYPDDNDKVRFVVDF